MNLKKEAHIEAVGQKYNIQAKLYPNHIDRSTKIMPGLSGLRLRLEYEIEHILLYLHNPRLKCCERLMAWRLLAGSLRHYMALVGDDRP